MILKIKKTIKRFLIFILSVFTHIYWSALIRFKLKKYFHELKLKKVKPLKFVFWEKKKKRAYKFLFSGFQRKEKVLVKIGFNDTSSNNEAIIYKKMCQNKSEYILFPNSITSKRISNSNYCVIVFPFISFPTLSHITSEEEFIRICDEACLILDYLFELDIVHADILARNIFLKDNHLLLFDFDEAFCEAIEPVVSYRNHGSFKRYIDEKAILDDAHSFSCVLNRLSTNKDFLHLKNYQELLDRVGRIYLTYQNKQIRLIKAR